MTPAPRSQPRPLLTIAEVADLCRVSTKTVRRWIGSRNLAAIKLGAQWRIDPKDLHHFLRERWCGQ